MDLINIPQLRFPRFFVNGELTVGGQAVITNSDAKHICTVLRMKPGEKVVLCSDDGYEYPSEIIFVQENCVRFTVLVKRPNDTEPGIYVRLFQCMPKGDKLDTVVQKATELGVSEIIPVISKRCMSKPHKNSNKINRLKKIAEHAAKQSGRGIIPQIHEFMSFNDAIHLYNKDNPGVIFYENGGKRINEIVKNNTNIDVFVGCEGGFDAAEIEAAVNAGFVRASLGKRILRTETAPIAAIAILMNITGDI